MFLCGGHFWMIWQLWKHVKPMVSHLCLYIYLVKNIWESRVGHEIIQWSWQIFLTLFLYCMVILGSWLKGGFVFKMREWGNGVFSLLQRKKIKFYLHIPMKMIFKNPFEKVKILKCRESNFQKIRTTSTLVGHRSNTKMTNGFTVKTLFRQA